MEKGTYRFVLVPTFFLIAWLYEKQVFAVCFLPIPVDGPLVTFHFTGVLSLHPSLTRR